MPHPENPRVLPTRLLLAILFLAHLTLFTGAIVHFCLNRRGPAHPGTLQGEGLFVRGDGLGYYAWLRSALLDGDWDFANEFDGHNSLMDEVPSAGVVTKQGRRANPWSVGPALAWAPAVIGVHVTLHALGRPLPADGYSWPYQAAVGVTTLGAGLIGVLLLHRTARRFAPSPRAAVVTALLVLGTPLLYYNAGEVSMAHGLASSAAALLVVYWLRSHGSGHPGRWLLLGLLVGTCGLFRWQLLALAMLPAGEALARIGRERSLLRPVGLLLLAGLAGVLALLPQAIAWKVNEGAWVTSPVVLERNWLCPDVVGLLFSFDRGLFYWTPAALVAFVGASLGCWRGPDRGPLLLLLLTFLMQVYILASIRGQGVFLGCAFGCRQLTESLVLLLPGLASFAGSLSAQAFRVLSALAYLLVLGNLTLIGLFCLHLLPRDAGADPWTLLTQVALLARRLPGPAVLVSVVSFVVLTVLLRPQSRILGQPRYQTA